MRPMIGGHGPLVSSWEVMVAKERDLTAGIQGMNNPDLSIMVVGAGM